MRKKTAPKFTIRQLARETGCDRASISKWLDGHNPKTKREALAIIDEHLPNGEPGAADPASGLSWFQASQREDTIRKRRLNEEQEAVQSKLWFPTDKMLEMFRAIVNRMEQWPGKLRSEAGLNDAQAALAQKLLDDTRRQIASDIEGLK